MTLIKKFSAPLIAVALVAMMAVSLLGQQRRAEAAITLLDFTAPIQAAGLTETWTVGATSSVVIPTGSTITVTFPTSFTTSGVVAANVTLGGAMFAGVTVASVTTGTGTVVITTAGATTAGAGTIAIASVVNGPVATYTGATTATATAGFALVASAGETVAVADATPPQLWNTTVVKSPTTSVQADGSSSVQLTFTTSNAAALSNTGSGATQSLTLSTDMGTFAQTPTYLAAWGAPVAITTPVTTNAATVAAAIPLSSTIIANLKAPTTAGTATVILRATPANGGQSVVVGSTQVVFTTATALPGAVASLGVTPAALSVANNAANAVTITAADANGTAVLNGTAITVTTSNGTFTICPGGTVGSGVCVTSVQAAGAVTVSITGSGVSGTQTITATAGSVTSSATVTLTGSPTTLEVSGRRTNSATSFVSKTNVENKNSTTNRDELMIAAVAKDANGNAVGAGTVNFTLTGPAGHTIVFTAVSEGGITITGAACSGGITGGTTCSDAIQGGAAGDTTPAHAVAYIDVDSTTGEPFGTYTVTATTVGASNATITGTTTFTTVGPPASLTIADIPLIGLGESTAVAITCKDADGNACAGGTVVQVNVSNANLIAQNAATGTTGITVGDLTTNTTTGVATVTLIGVTAGTTNIVANVGTVTAVKVATVGSTATPPPTTGGVFSGATIAPTGLTIVSFTGTVAQLNTAGAAAKVVSAHATVGGKLVSFVVGAPDFVNAAFNAAFPTGLSNTLMIVKTGS